MYYLSFCCKNLRVGTRDRVTSLVLLFKAAIKETKNPLSRKKQFLLWFDFFMKSSRRF